ncbi:uncharacterized protein LOC126732488 isoform X3 [Quercus robur]|uniref:uncharacterized protein LOC126732488 isoform X3 n=1 Tax=Quercus robur TaxID=38942 RepID=UPI0021610C78|nr:uncharacterized protein LOC126732488 isoform X3 [Quercus robur]
MDLLNDSSDSQHNDADFDLSDDIVLAAYLAGCACLAYVNTYMTKVPLHTNIQTGLEWVQYILTGHEKKCRRIFRMSSYVFRQLCNTLRQYGYYGTRGVCVEESLAMTLMILGHGEGNRMVQERFQHSGETVHRHMGTVVTLLATVMARDIIQPADRTFRDVPEHIQHSDRYWPHFKGCIGAIDGVHVPVVIDVKDQLPYYGRKGITTTNCMCACDFDMKFTFACVGWEGSAHDTRIFYSCVNNESYNFPNAPAGKYYLVDSGYPMRKGFLAPYKGERYHIGEFRPSEVLHRPEERFNYLHSSLRSVIERTFGVWKNKWRILRHMPPFKDLQRPHHLVVRQVITMSWQKQSQSWTNLR